MLESPSGSNWEHVFSMEAIAKHKEKTQRKESGMIRGSKIR
jgi:hypothetical protein